MNEDFIAFPNDAGEDVAGGNQNVKSRGLPPALLTNVRPHWLRCSSLSRNKGSPNQLVALHNEIIDFCEYISPSEVELATRENTLKELTTVIHELWPQSRVCLFGSQMTKILTPSSDIDIAILDVPEPTAGQDIVDQLHDLDEKIREKHMVSYIEVISNAKVPIIKLDHRQTGISIDICLNNSSGLTTGKIIRRLLRQYPPLKPLTMVLKMFLSQRRLNETYSGGIGSFVLTTMVVSFLQMRRRQEAARGTLMTWNLGSLLLDFLQLYGGTFNYIHTGISIRDGGAYFEKKYKEDSWYYINRPNSLAVENPDVPEVDMGKNSFMMPKIRRAFEHALQLLTAALTSDRVESYLAFLVRPDDPALCDRPALGISLNSARHSAAAAADEDDSDSASVDDQEADASASAETSTATAIKVSKDRKRKPSKRDRDGAADGDEVVYVGNNDMREREDDATSSTRNENLNSGTEKARKRSRKSNIV